MKSIASCILRFDSLIFHRLLREARAKSRDDNDFRFITTSFGGILRCDHFGLGERAEEKCRIGREMNIQYGTHWSEVVSTDRDEKNPDFIQVAHGKWSQTSLFGSSRGDRQQSTNLKQMSSSRNSQADILGFPRMRQGASWQRQDGSVRSR